MPSCPACDNRPFINKEALLQHLKSSSAPHPVCDFCDRRFVSDAAYNAHMLDKHPPTYDCTACNRSYHAPFALEDHYRGSVAHPNCVRCGRGFKDDAHCEEHLRVAHPKMPCTQCGGILLYEDALDQHFWDSLNHPSCNLCHRGFKDDLSYVEHFSSSHPELHCGPCNENFETTEAIQAHFLASPVHPKCAQCSLGFVDNQSHDSHVETVHTPTPPQATDAAEGNLTPAEVAAIEEAPQPQPSPAEPPKSDVIPMYSTGFTPLSPRHRLQNVIVGERRINSPDLRLDLGFTSPLTEVKPLFSPTSLPRPADNIERFWNSRENIQITPSRPPLTPQPNTQNGNSENYSHFYRRTDPGPSRNSLPTWFDPTQPSFRPREGRHFSPPQIPPAQVSPPRTDLRARLYPGSVRHAMRTASLTRPAPPTDLQLGDSTGRNDLYGSHSHRSFGSTSGSVSAGSQSFLEHYRGPGSSDHVNWKELIGGVDQDPSSIADRASLFSETLTPKAEMPDYISQSHLGIQVQNSTPSPSLATISSPASSALGHSPGSAHNEPDTRPTTASSTKMPYLHGLTYTVTPSSECPSPRSPEVTSPTGLGILPTISPLVSTPIDLVVFDIPEAQKPLPDSPVETASPFTVVLDLKPQQQVPVSSTSPLSTSSTQSYITSPQEPSDTTLASVETAVTSPATPTVPVANTTNPNPLHCRVCLADSCDDITASMCGHIFCNRCITDAVIKTNRCPVCMTPTLLYCLFRLDLAA